MKLSVAANPIVSLLKPVAAKTKQVLMTLRLIGASVRK